jgi:tRNA nucleotidyltransferase (CCA-adding enzyme)
MTIEFFAHKAQKYGIKIYAVGGYVRDMVMGITPKDVDFVITGVTVEYAKEIFGSFTPIHPKAPVYGVWVDGIQYEVAFPRIEVSTGSGKEDFEFITTDDISQDAVRRDFTMNAMYMDVVTGEIFDPFGGMKDIEDKVIRHCSDKFAESPERIYRAIVFQARYGFDIAPETMEVMKGMADTKVAIEQIWKQGFSKIFAGGKYFHKAFSTMVEAGFAPKAIVDMVGCPQPAKYHPEGDVFTHMCESASYMSQIYTSDFGVSKDVAVAVAFAHDMGKPETTQVVDGKITAYGHEDSDVPYQFFAEIGFPVAMVEVAKVAIKGHMQRFESGSKKEVAKWARKAGKFTDFCFAVIEADCMGRASSSHIPATVMVAKEVASTFAEQDTFTPFVTGDEIMAIKGIKPGKMVGIIKEAVIEAQVEGRVTCKAEAVEFVSKFA